MHTNGISFEGDVLDLGVTEKVVTRSGSWFKYNDDYLGQGKEKARAFLMENPEICEEIRQKVLAAGGHVLGDQPVTVDTPATDPVDSGASTSNGNSTEAKTTEAKTAEAKTADTKSADTKSVDTKSVDDKADGKTPAPKSPAKGKTAKTTAKAK